MRQRLQPAISQIGGYMFLAEVDPTKAFLTVATSLIGAVVVFFKWQGRKDAGIQTANANAAAGHDKEIEKLWKKVSETEEIEKQLRIDLEASRADYRKLEEDHRNVKQQLAESRDDRQRLHFENSQLTAKIDGHLSNMAKLVADNIRLTKQNEGQAAQLEDQARKILFLEQKLGMRSSTNGEG